jgi:hypothetical protein
MRDIAGLLLIAALASTARADVTPDTVKSAIEKGLRRLEQGAASYITHRQCFSCHHQTSAVLAFVSAGKRGFAVDAEKLKEQVEFTLETFRPKLEQVVKGQGVGGSNTTAAYALFTLDAAGHPPDEVTAALVKFLLVRQRADGAWPAVTKRPPSEGSPFPNAAFALRLLRAYGPPTDEEGSEELRARIDKAIAKGREWLLANTPTDTEDKVFHLRALVSAEADPERIAAARDRLLKEQKEDGSWAQLPEMAGDAYATGHVLMALRAADLPATHPAYQKAIKYLLATQRDDGAWIVETRSRPIQTFFDNADPGGKSQFISFAATGWAVQALLEVLPVK